MMTFRLAIQKAIPRQSLGNAKAIPRQPLRIPLAFPFPRQSLGNHLAAPSWEPLAHPKAILQQSPGLKATPKAIAGHSLGQCQGSSCTIPKQSIGNPAIPRQPFGNPNPSPIPKQAIGKTQGNPTAA